MLSVGAITSASGAADYFARDEYYTCGETGDHSEWGGKGAEALGLDGKVTKEDFKDILNGRIGEGQQVGDPENRRLGTDLTFSMPKSASLMAYVAGDNRVIELHREAVRETMGWAEKNLAEARDYSVNKKGEPVQTGKLVYGLFEHETSRALDPQGHIHAVVANITQREDGKWVQLWNEQLWKSNTLLGAIYHSQFRAKLENAGYDTRTTGKHGQFEISGIEKSVMAAFSQRRQDIVKTAQENGYKTPQALREITNRTRDKKPHDVARAELVAEWKARAREMGWTGLTLLKSAQIKAREVTADLRLVVADRSDRLRYSLSMTSDHLVDRDVLRGPAGSLATQQEVGSAIRQLGEREAVLSRADILKTVLNTARTGVTLESTEKRINQLQARGVLIAERSHRQDGKSERFTTRDELAREHAILKMSQEGRGKAAPIVAEGEAYDRLQAATELTLLPEQAAAASLALASTDKVVAVQGRAGAGKSTMLNAMARVAEGEGKRVLGLAVQNKMVSDLKDGAGIEAQSISSFVNAHIKKAGEDVAEQTLKDTLLVVDESSMVSNKQMVDVMTIAQKLGAERLVLVGDRKQLLAVEAGKSFEVLQKAGTRTAIMDTNLRQQTDQLRAVASLAGKGHSGLALKVLGDKVTAHDDPSSAAAKAWLALPGEERARTSLLASGRAARSNMNEIVQSGLKADGTLGKDAARIVTFVPQNLTREELRKPASYEPGLSLEVGFKVRGINLARGTYDIIANDGKGKVTLKDRDGKTRTIKPERIKPNQKQLRLEIGEKKQLEIHKGETIRWGSNDKARGLYGSDLASVVSIERDSVTIRNAKGDDVTMPKSDPMLARIDLGYAMNAHMAQGITRDRVIASMNSREGMLANQRLFNVSVTRERQDLQVFTDSPDKLAEAMKNNPGDKSSALEATGMLERIEASLKAGKTGGLEDEAGKSALEASLEKTSAKDMGLGLPDSLKAYTAQLREARQAGETAGAAKSSEAGAAKEVQVKDIQKTLDLKL